MPCGTCLAGMSMPYGHESSNIKNRHTSPPLGGPPEAPEAHWLRNPCSARHAERAPGNELPGCASERLKRAPRWILRAYSARDDVVSFRIRSQIVPGRSFDTSAGICGNGLPRELGLIYAFKCPGPKNPGRGVVCQTYSENATKQPQIGGAEGRARCARAPLSGLSGRGLA